MPQLSLGIDGMGPLEFGTDGAEILGRLTATFGQPAENTGLFERAWYGLHTIGEEAVDHFMKNYETITGEPA